MKVKSTIVGLAEKLNKEGIELFVVGGACRDHHMNVEPKDFDLVAVATQEQLFSVTGNLPNILPNSNNLVFGWNDGEETHELALARIETSTGGGKNDFEFQTAKSISDDLKRRDLTINAIAFNILKKTWIDPFNGIEDIKNKIFRHVSDAFVESPERVFRVVMKFMSRFGFTIAPETVELMRSMVSTWEWGMTGKNGDVLAIIIPNAEKPLSCDQIWRQGASDMLGKGTHPELVFAAMVAVGLDRLFEEIF